MKESPHSVGEASTMSQEINPRKLEQPKFYLSLKEPETKPHPPTPSQKKRLFER
jgi:hypothetical protein